MDGVVAVGVEALHAAYAGPFVRMRLTAANTRRIWRQLRQRSAAAATSRCITTASVPSA